MIKLKSLGIQVLGLMVLLIFATSCGKDRDGKDFIEFELDGNFVRIESVGSTEGNINAKIAYVADRKLLSVGYTGLYNGLASAGSFGFSQPDDFAAQSYSFDGTAPGGMLFYPSFIYVFQTNEGYTLTPNGAGNITFTFYAGSNVGDVIEGTFNFTGVEKKDSGGNVVNPNLTLSNGRFKFTIE